MMPGKNITFPVGKIMPNTPVENIPEGFEFIRIESDYNEAAVVWLKCQLDGEEYAFQLNWKDKSNSALTVGRLDGLKSEKQVERELKRLELKSKILEKK